MQEDAKENRDFTYVCWHSASRLAAEGISGDHRSTVRHPYVSSEALRGTFVHLGTCSTTSEGTKMNWQYVVVFVEERIPRSGSAWRIEDAI